MSVRDHHVGHGRHGHARQPLVSETVLKGCFVQHLHTGQVYLVADLDGQRVLLTADDRPERRTWLSTLDIDYTVVTTEVPA